MKNVILSFLPQITTRHITMITLCMISLAAFAGKGPKGKLISYSHTQVNPEMPLTSEFSLNWQDGKGILTIYELFLTNENKFTAEVSEDVFRQVTDIIKQKELYAIGKKKRRKAEPVPVSDPGQEVFSIKFEDKSIDCDAKSLRDEQREALCEIETIIRYSVKSVKPPKGELVECSWSCQPMLPGREGEYGFLSVREDGTPVLSLGKDTTTPDGKIEKKYNVTDADVKELRKLILETEAYKMDGYQGSDRSGESPEFRLFLKYDDGAVYQARWSHQYPPDEVKNALGVIAGFLTTLTKKYQPIQSFPEGRMTYCSCTYTNNGLPVGEIQHCYYELVADEGTKPKVIYCEDRGSDKKKKEYPATEQDISELTNLLKEINAFELDGYHVEERMTGGRSYRIYMEFSGGEKLNATWFTHSPRALAEEAYGTILRSLKAVTERAKP